MHPDLIHMLIDPQHEVPAFTCRIEGKCRRALHMILNHGNLDAPAHIDEFHPPAIGSHQTPFARAHGNEEFTLGMFAIDLDRSGKPQGDLRYAGEILNISLGEDGVKGMLLYMIELGAGVPF